MSTTIDSLQLEVQSQATSAVAGIDALSASLSKLRTAVKGGVGLTSVANQLKNLNAALDGVDDSAAGKLESLANSLDKLKGLGNLKISSSIASQLTAIGTAARSLDGVNFHALSNLANAIAPLSHVGSLNLNSAISQLNRLPGAINNLNSVDMGEAARKVRELVNALIPLTAIGNSNLGSFFREIRRLPEMLATLNGLDMETLTNQIQRLATALAPLASRMNDIARGFAAFPERIQRLIRSNDRLSESNNRAANSYVNLWAKCRMAVNVVRSGARIIASWITETNAYIENLNLFTVSMGEYADEAKKYAEQVEEVMGIKSSEWMRNQGIFNTIITGFGVAGDKASLMSRNLTQLGYDLSSFNNSTFEEAMQKLQSGIAGELEPLRRWGYDLSLARLEQERLRLGINKSVSSMTQAEKSQLRYYAIMTQVTHVQGDLARTLESPANQLRILRSQVELCGQAFGNLFLPILKLVLPYVIALAKVLRMLLEAVATFFNISLGDFSLSTDTIDIGASAAGDLADGLGNASENAKKLKNNLLGIDELNILSSQDDSGSGAGAGLGGSDLGIELPDNPDWLKGVVSSQVDDIVQMIKDAMWEITAVISGFLLAIGTILVVTGANIPLGLGLMAIGAIGLGATIVENWNSMSERLAKVLSIVTAVIGGFLLAIGAILTFSGVNVPLGIALMVAGAVAIATAVALNWNFIEDKLRGILAILTGIVGGALLALGALFVFTGVDIPLGLALMVAGAAAILTAVALNWDCIPDSLKKVITIIDSIVGGALLALGTILTFTGANIPLGIAMMAAGAVLLAAAVVLNWDSITGDLKQSISTITAIVSGALIGIGAVLAFTGVATPLGIAMIAAGAIGLVATAAINWESLTGKVKEVLKNIGIEVGGALLALGAVLTFTGVATPVGIALMAAGAASLIAGVALNWDSIGSKLKEVLKEIGIIAGAALLAIGLILCLTGVGIPLGVALIAAGAAGLATGVALNWEEIKNKVGEGLDGIAEKFGPFKEKVSQKLDEAAQAISGWWDNVKEFWTKGDDGKNGFDNFKEIGHNIVEGFTQGVTEFFSDPLGWIKEHIVDPFVEGFKKLFGIHSPSTVMAEIGENVALGLLNGILEPFKNIGKWIKQNIITPLKNAIEKSPIGEFIVNVKNTAHEWWQNVKDWWEGATKNGLSLEAVVTLARKGWTTVKNWIGNIPTLSQAIALIKQGWDTVTEWIGNIPVVKQGVELVKHAWDTVAKWIGEIPIIKQGIQLIKDGWNTVREWVGNIPTLSQAIALLKSGWTTVKNWIGEIPVLSQAIQLIKSGWSTVRDWIGNIPTLDQAIQLIKSGWTTVKNWVGNIPTLDQAIQLVKSGWKTVRDWIGTIPVLDQAIQLIKSGWTTVKNWVGYIPTLDQAIQLVKSGWATVAGWIGNIPVISQAIQLIKSGWSTVSGWIGNIPTLSQSIQLVKSGWSTVSGWIGSLPVISQAVSLAKSGWSTVSSWIGSMPTVSAMVSLAKSGWTSISGFVGSSVSVAVSLVKSGWTSLSTWIGSKVSVGVELFKSGWSSIKSFFGLSSGGYDTGHGWKFFEKGGWIDNGQAQFWKNIPMYANGTNNAGLHGSMFVAGENGAEMVGHINGQTEVLNRSQIAMAMKNAVVEGMSLYTGYWRALYGQMAVCSNAIIRSVLVSCDVLNASMADAVAYDPTNDLAQMVYEDSKRAYERANNTDGMGQTIREFYREYVEPTLREIAADTKRQADKEEQTIVQIGNRVITDAVETQRKANGFVFAK